VQINFFIPAFHNQAPPIPEHQISIIITEDISVGLLIGKVVGKIVESKAHLEKGLGGYLPGDVIAEASPEHPAIMLQYPVDSFDGFSLFTLQPVIVLVLASGITEFLVGPAPEGFSAGQAGRRYCHGSFHHILFAGQK
jgi:hypothetical protein